MPDAGQMGAEPTDRMPDHEERRTDHASPLGSAGGTAGWSARGSLSGIGGREEWFILEISAETIVAGPNEEERTCDLISTL